MMPQLNVARQVHVHKIGNKASLLPINMEMSEKKNTLGDTY